MAKTKLTPAEKDMNAERRTTILKRADRFEAKRVRRGFYFNPDHGSTVCRPCLDRLIRAGLVVGGDATGKQTEWLYDDPSADRDLIPRCEAPEFKIDGKEVGCGRFLRGWLTAYGAREELNHFEEEGFNARNFEHCYIWMLCDNALGGDEAKALLKLLSPAKGARR